MYKRALLAVLVVAAGVAGASPRVSDAVAVRQNVVFTVPPAAIAGVPGNLRIAWVERGDHVMLARLGDDFRLIDASIEEIGRGDDPRLAYDGERFYVAFADTRKLLIVVRRTDDSRTVTFPAPRTASFIPEAVPVPLPYSMTWSGGALHFLFGVKEIYDQPLSPSLEIGDPVKRLQFVYGELTAQPATAMIGNVIAAAANTNNNLLDFGTTAGGTSPFTTLHALGSFFMPAIAASGRDFLAVTRSRCISECGELRAQRFALDGAPLGPPEGQLLASGLRYDFDRLTAAAWTGAAWLVVYGVRTSFDQPPAVDLWGILIAEDGRAGEPFPIAASAAAERAPSLLALGSGRMLITYLADSTLEARLIETAPRPPRPIRTR